MTGRRSSSLYVVRHAQPEQRMDVPYALSPGPDLSEIGRAQASALAAFLRGAEAKRIVSSPFARARQTADLIAAALGLPVEIDAALSEMGPEEPWQEVEGRIARWWAGQEARSDGMVVVSHGAVITALLLLFGRQRLDLAAPDGRQDRTPQGAAWLLTLEDGTCEGRLVWIPEDGGVGRLPGARRAGV